jgi:probable phosphoglycerate mutase
MMTKSKQHQKRDQAVIYVDGLHNGSLGSWGWIAYDPEGRIISEGFDLCDAETSNEAEYRASIDALQWVGSVGFRQVKMLSDSRLMVNQVTGYWRCKALNLQPLLSQVLDLSRDRIIRWGWIPREENVGADHLSRQALMIEQVERRHV